MGRKRKDEIIQVCIHRDLMKLARKIGPFEVSESSTYLFSRQFGKLGGFLVLSFPLLAPLDCS